jgi:hypothetical protein
MGRRAKSPKGKVEAKRAPARKSPKDEGSGVRDLEGRLAEALGQLQTRDRELVEAQEQQTATSEILQVISSSPTDVQPVFDAIARNAARLCDAYDAAIFRRDGNQLILVAQEGPIPYGPYGPIGTFTVPVVRARSTADRCWRDGRSTSLICKSRWTTFPRAASTRGDLATEQT